MPALLSLLIGITDPNSSLALLQLLLRWVHFFAGTTWIGLLYYFNLVQTPFLRTLSAETRAQVFPGLMTRAMRWFRWSAVVTVLMGFGYWNIIVYADSQNAHLHHLPTGGKVAILSFLTIWTVAFFIEFAVLMLPVGALQRGPILGIIVVIVVIASGYGWLSLNSHAWESSRMQAIGVGGGIGWFMMLNVWGVIWRIQKKLIRWTRENALNQKPMPPGAAKLAQQAVVVSRINFVLSFPLLLLMGAASHYPFIVD